MRYRVTVRDEGVELRGYVDGTDKLIELAGHMEGVAIVVASPAEEGYEPFSSPVQ